MHDIGSVARFAGEALPGMFGGAVAVTGAGMLAAEWETTIYWAEVELEGGTRRDVALRVFPYREVPFDDKARHEYEVMRALAGKAPVPDVYGIVPSFESSLGAPVIAMERIHGETLSSRYWGNGAAASTLCTFTDALARLHAVDVAGLEGVGADFDLDDPAAYSLLWLTAIREAVDELQLDDLRPVARWLERDGSPAPCARYSMLHGDYHLKNVMVDNAGRVAIIDWPASRVGDPLDDLAWTYVLSIEHPTIRDAVVAEYGARTGRSLLGLDTYLVKAALSRIQSTLLALFPGPGANDTPPELREKKLGCKGQLLECYSLIVRLTGLQVPSIRGALAMLG